jgi:crotonobetainyl-CoA:carnitine CoA-transferase CaiB-like acyl-CoA transferase
VKDEKAGEMHVPGLAIKFSKTPGSVGVVPSAGQHTDALLSSLPGYGQARVDQLRAAGVVQ